MQRNSGGRRRFVLRPGLARGELGARTNRLIPPDAKGRGRGTTPLLHVDPDGALLDTIAVVPDVEYYASPEGRNAQELDIESVRVYALLKPH